MIVILLITVLVTFAVFYFFYRQPLNLLPGPVSIPIFGGLHLLDPEVPHLSLTQLAEKYGSVYTIKLGMINTVVISDARILKKVLLKDEASGRPPLFVLKSVLQNKGILYSTGSLWKDQRKFIINFLRSFGASKVSANRNYFEKLILRNAQKFIEHVGKEKETRLNPSEAVTHFVSGISSQVLLGQEWSRDDQILKTMFQEMEEMAKLTAVGGPLNFLPFLRFLPKFRKTTRLINKLLEHIHSLQSELISKTRKKYTGKEVASNLIYAFLGQQSKCNSEDIYNLEQLRFLVIDMFGASVETTVNSILWTFLYLAVYESVQNKVREELNQVLQNKTPEINDLSNLPHLEATIAEVARIQTVIPLGFPHYALEDICVDHIKISKGSMILPLLWGIHMDPKVWDAPEKFRPDRFLNDEGQFYQPESFIPFQTGRRMCVGETFAKMAVSLFIAITLQSFKIKSCGSINLTGICGLIMSPIPQELCFIKL